MSGVKKKQRKASGQAKKRAEMDESHAPETELACLTVTAAEQNEKSLLKDYIKMRKTLDESFDINEKDSKGLTVLFIAVWSQKLPIVKICVENGADANVADHLGFTPIFWATGRYPSAEVAAYLIEEGHASVQVTTLTGATPLHGATLMGNMDCIKLLLKHGVDPRQPDKEDTFPLDLAKDDVTKAALHKALRHTDNAVEKQSSCCFQCGKLAGAESRLKRCGRCHVALYCDRECQEKHWKHGGHKDGCAGYVLAIVQPYASAINCGPLNYNQKSHASVYTRSKKDVAKAAGFLGNKKFIVKVQVPLGPDTLSQGVRHEMFVYNEDRSVMGIINGDAAGYMDLRRRIAKGGFMGVKAFFWAELSDKPDESFKVFHGKCAPMQQW